MELIINARLKSHIPPLRPEELSQLEANILRDGCTTPLIVWGDVLVDGHNRYAICKKLDIPFTATNKEFETLEAAIAWIEENQLGRRNLTADQFAYFIGRKYARAKKVVGRPAGSDPTEQLGKNCQIKSTAEVVAAEHGVSPRTVRNADTYAKQVDEVADVLGDGARGAILSGKEGLTRSEVKELAQDLHVGAAKAEGLHFSDEKEALKWIKEYRQKKAEDTREVNAAIKATEVALPSGKFETIVIDPPWDMKKIERDVRENQVDFDYPTMSEDQLIEFGEIVRKMAHVSCHVFMWTTQKYLPMALRLLEKWGAKYVLTMTWHKKGGPQPFGLPQYNSEFVVYARIGTPKFENTKDFPTCFNGERREHSRKPVEFYEMIKRVTDGKRIDVFSREKYDGFEQYGNEINKFSEVA